MPNIVFLTVKTTSQYPDYNSLPANIKFQFYERYRREITDLIDRPLFDEKTKKITCVGAKAFDEVYDEKAPLSAEFGKIICVGMGRLKDNVLKTVILDGEEKDILNDLIIKGGNTFGAGIPKEVDIAGHGIKGFHFPFLAKRYLINGLALPKIFDLSGLKPWDITFLADTSESWKMTSWDGYASLDLLSDIFGMPKTDEQISGRQVKDIYWKEKDAAKIKKYCYDDLWNLANVYIKMKGLPTQISR